MKVSYILLILLLFVIVKISENKITIFGNTSIIYREKNTFNYFVNSLKYKHLEKKIKLADKYYARKFIQNNFSNISVFPLLYSTSNPKDLLKLTINQKCVVKASNGSGFNQIVDNINEKNRHQLYLKSKKWLQTDYRNGPLYRLTEVFNEPQYQKHKDVQRMVLVEKYMGKINDIKFHMAYGKILFIQMQFDRSYNSLGISKTKNNLYDKNWKLLPFLRSGTENTKYEVDRPKNLNQMINFCYQFYQKTKIEYVRIDLYEIEDKIYFGEFTFTPFGSFAHFSDNYNYKLYNMVKKFELN
jgi:hypothetical protein